MVIGRNFGFMGVGKRVSLLVRMCAGMNAGRNLVFCKKSYILIAPVFILKSAIGWVKGVHAGWDRESKNSHGDDGPLFRNNCVAV